tara:strand:- start:317 stop:1222 length:906 start_codon:yes stop_codon:yes gene_type:complete
MEFVNANRSKDSEFLAGLQNYGAQVFEDNKSLDLDIKAAGDTQLQQQELLEGDQAEKSVKTTLSLAGVGVGGLEKAKRIVPKVKAANTARKEASAARDLAANRAQGWTRGARPAGAGGEVEARGAARGAARGGAAAAEVENPLADAARVGGSAEARAGLEASEEGAGKLLAKGAGVLARGAGLVGAGISAADAINDYRNGKHGWAQALEIGGAGAEVFGTILEFTPLAPLGLALQVGGAAASAVGTGIAAEESEAETGKNIQASKDEASKATKDLEAQRRTAVSGLSTAGQGGFSVARAVQ